MTPLHVRAKQGEVAPLVLLPGDPGRAEWIAKTFLSEPKNYTSYRSLLGFTGTYKGVSVSVQTTGMGCPSAAIVTEELHQLGAEAAIRVGTCGVVDPALEPGHLVIVQGAIPLDGTTRHYLNGRPYAPLPDYQVVEALVQAARETKVKHHVGLIATEDGFYANTPEAAKDWAKWGVKAFEMESSAIFTVAKLRGMKAGTLLTVVNQIGDTAFAPPGVIQKGVENMARVGLEALLLIHQRT